MGAGLGGNASGNVALGALDWGLGTTAPIGGGMGGYGAPPQQQQQQQQGAVNPFASPAGVAAAPRDPFAAGPPKPSGGVQFNPFDM